MWSDQATIPNWEHWPQSDPWQGTQTHQHYTIIHVCDDDDDDDDDNDNHDLMIILSTLRKITLCASKLPQKYRFWC